MDLFNGNMDYKDSELNELKQKKINFAKPNNTQEGDFWNQFESVNKSETINNEPNNTQEGDFWNQFESVDKSEAINNEPDLTDRSKEFIKPIVTNAAIVPDVVNKYVAAPITAGASKLASSFNLDEIGGDLAKLSNKYHNSNIEGEIKNSEFFKKNYKPDKISQVNEDLGEVTSWIVPLNKAAKVLQLVGKGGNILKLPFVDKVAKIIQTPMTTSGLSTVGASSIGSTVAQQQLLSDDATNGEKITASVAGSILGGLTVKPTTDLTVKGIKSISNTIISAYDNPKNFFKSSSLKEIRDSVPENILDVSAIKILEGAGNKADLVTSISEEKMPAIIGFFLPEKTLNESLKTLNKSSILTIEKKLDEQIFNKTKIPENYLKYEQLENSLKNSIDLSKNAKNSLYDKVRSSIGKNDYISPNNLKNTLNEIKPLYEALPVSKGERGGFHNILNTISEKISGDKIPLSKIDLQRKSLNSIMRSLSAEQLEQKMQINSIIKALDEDVLEAGAKGTIKSKEFINNLKNANAYYKDIYVPVAKTDITRTILSGEKPYYVFELLKNPNGINKFNSLIKSMENSNPEKRELINNLGNTLKRVKLQEVIFEKTKVDGNSDKINYKYMEDLFRTETSRNTIRELAGGTLYNDLKNHSDKIMPVLKKLQNLINNRKSSTLSNISNIKNTKDVGKLAIPAYILGSKGLGALMTSKFGLGLLASKINSNETLMKMFIKRASDSDELTPRLIAFFNKLAVSTTINAEISTKNKQND